LISEQAILKVVKTYKDSDIARIQNQLEDLKNTKALVQNITDRLSQYFILAVFSIAFVFFVYYARFDVFEAFQRSLALLIVACPCAMALGTPLAYLMGAYRSKKNGILIFQKDIFDRILEAKYLFFDKTGTLTYGIPQITSIRPENPDLINILLNLEKRSMHPLALALRKKYHSVYSDLKIETTEILGQGVSGLYKGQLYSFEKDPSGRSSSHLLCDGKKVLELTFEDQLRPETQEVIVKLKSYFKNEIGILSGDSQIGAQHISKQVGIDLLLTNHTPEMKFEAIKAHNPCIMVGDGWNDALALQAAHVGIAVNGSVQASADHSDAYFLKKGIGQILTLIDISKKVRKTLISNLALSLFYNLAAGAMALSGAITPLVAAVLMPLSSVAILINTIRGVR
jgi:Cu2+-exporting ATPase/Cu+-exporting ATPase